jgi:hypothetical protein
MRDQGRPASADLLAEPMAAPDVANIEDHAPPLAPVDDDAGQVSSNQIRDDGATPPGEMPPMPKFLDRLQATPEPEPVFEEDVPEDDRSSGRPEDEWEGSSTRWD